jgi:hypothetical protein
MSHTLEVKTKFLDPSAIAATCREMGLPAMNPQPETVTLYDGTRVFGYAVQLPNWSYPVAIDAKTGAAKYDNYRGSWGKQQHLDRFTQLYAANKATLTAQKQGLRVTRQTLPNGSLKLVVSGYR